MLERLLNSSERVFSTGELHVLWRLPSDLITCSCGAKLRHCAAWRDILRTFGKGEDKIGELARLELLVCRTGFIRAHGFDPRRIRGNTPAARFLDLQRALFGAIARTMGKEIIVDSSKAGPRAFLLSCLDTPKFIHVRRDPVDVIASWRSRKFDKGLGGDMRRLSAAKAAGDWMKSEYFARKIAAIGDVAFIDYADFCGNPRGTVAGIADRLALNLDDIAWTGTARFEPGKEYHSLNGNPDRFSDGPVDIVTRSADRADLSLRDSVASTVLGNLAGAIFPTDRRPVRRERAKSSV